MKKLLLITLAFFELVSCETPASDEQLTNPTPTAHIYAVGNNGDGEAYITKDGVSTSIGISGYYVYDIFVDGNDVYTCGSVNNVATYTKNGIQTLLGASTVISSAEKIFIKGNDIYFIGHVFDNLTLDDHPVYWKNGALNILNIAPGFKGRAYDITISNNDVYIAGYQHNFDSSNPITNILYWKNGVLTTINSSHVYSFNWVGEISIAVDNNDVYLAVNERDNNSPIFNSNVYLIKNGVEETLIDDNSEVLGIFISNSEIYLCGNHLTSSGLGTKSVVWKNGEVVVEKDVERGTFTSLYVSNNNIIAVGVETNLVSGTYNNHSTTLINNVFTTGLDFGNPVGGSGYMSVFVTE